MAIDRLARSLTDTAKFGYTVPVTTASTSLREALALTMRQRYDSPHCQSTYTLIDFVTIESAPRCGVRSGRRRQACPPRQISARSRISITD